ncbi:type II secretion system minor pseudopilin GspI [Oceanicaulis alexandrii]|uniref:type II secretion system minor pseudopilin GspI n=1 Tax=Oceanicaulis alexandrii TaxID=153233 RepID=UPI0023539F7F|nr:type II secretion system minor pseudopilin GspI [Oceanicaulis alexandrii]
MTGRRQAGFSLIEMLAALTILALAGVALMNALTTSTRSATLAREMTLAQIAAQNLLSEQILDTDPGQMRERTGEYALGGLNFSWRLEIEATGQPDLVRLRMVVSDPETEAVYQALETLRRTS